MKYIKYSNHICFKFIQNVGDDDVLFVRWMKQKNKIVDETGRSCRCGSNLWPDYREKVATQRASEKTLNVYLHVGGSIRQKSIEMMSLLFYLQQFADGNKSRLTEKMSQYRFLSDFLKNLKVLFWKNYN